MKNYENFTEWQKDQDKKFKKIISSLVQLVARIAPDLSKTAKWGNGCWIDESGLPIIYIHSEVDHIQFGFFGGSLLDDPMKLLRGKAKFVRHIRIEKHTDIDLQSYSKLVKQALTTKYR